MQYYTIKESVDSKVIGRKFPQVQRPLFFEKWNDERALEAFTGKEAPPDVFLPQAILYKSAKVTDLISTASVGFSNRLLVSQKMWEIISGFNYEDVQALKTVVFENTGKEHSYFILHPFQSHYEYLDLKQSEMGYYKDFLFKELVRPFSPPDVEYLEKEIRYYESNINYLFSVGQVFHISKVVLVKSMVSDLFILNYVHAGTQFYISERLKDALEKQKCTGVEYVRV